MHPGLHEERIAGGSSRKKFYILRATGFQHRAARVTFLLYSAPIAAAIVLTDRTG